MNNSISTNKLRFCVLLGMMCLILTVRCAPEKEDQEVVVIPSAVIPTLLPSETSIPLKATPTITPLRITSATSIQTFTIDEAESHILQQVTNNGDCRLPCVWGLQPSAERKIIEDYFQKFPSVIKGEKRIYIYKTDDYGDMYYEYEDAYGQTNIEISYHFASDKLTEINYFSSFLIRQEDGFSEMFGSKNLDELLRPYFISGILSEYGQPADVFFHAWNLDPMDRHPHEIYLIALYYPDQGFLVQYNGYVKENTGEELIICPRELSILLTTWDPALHYTLENAAKSGTTYNINDKDLESYHRIGEVTSLTNEEFYQTYKNPDYSECFETAVDLWNY